jgi:broad specificity phosphatase PhoE
MLSILWASRVAILALVISSAVVLSLQFSRQERPSMPPALSSKTIFAIRHGTSTANEYMKQPGSQWGEPSFCDKMDVDAPLSRRGLEEAHGLLKHSDLYESVDLVLVSPLRRCLQTYQLGIEPVCTKKAVVQPLLRERVYTQSDTSQYTLGQLSRQYPSLDWNEALQHGEPWYYTCSPNEKYVEWRPNDANQWYAVPGEPLVDFENRMKVLEEWLAQRPEKNILMIAHWGVIRHFTSQETENCHAVQFKLEPLQPNNKKTIAS